MHITDAQIHELACDADNGVWSASVVLVSDDGSCVFRCQSTAGLDATPMMIERLLVADAIRQAQRLPEYRAGHHHITRAARMTVQIIRAAA